MYKMQIHADKIKGKINREIYGHFSEHLGRCIYGGIYVGEDSPIENVNGMRKDVMDALKEIRLPVLRWPGGCFADEYHWMDGIGPKEKRKKIVNTHWGGVIEDNSFGTHEYFELCRQLGCKTYVNGNLGSGTIKEMSDWVEYITFEGMSPMSQLRGENGSKESWNIDYWGVGNENWGCGGNMTAEYYANEYRRYQTYVRDYKNDRKISKICCGPNAEDFDWTREVLAACFRHSQPEQHGFMDGLSLHYYTVPNDWKVKGSATEFDEKDWYRTLNKTLFMEELIQGHGAIMDEYDPDKNIGMIIDEWGTWFDCEPGTNPGFLYQQSTMRDALVAGINLNIFNQHCDRVKMANLAQTVNVLQSVLLTEGDKLVKTPTYYVFHMYKCHQDATLVESSIETKQIGLQEQYMVPNLTQSVSVDKNGTLHITVTNLSADEGYDIEAEVSGRQIKEAEGEILTGDIRDGNTFDNPDQVKTLPFDSAKVGEKGLQFHIPACSIIHLEIKE